MNIAKSLCIMLIFILGMKPLLTAQQVHIQLDSCIKASTVIFEGAVISSTSFLGPDSNVHTSNIVKVLKIFKGNVQCGNVEIITEQSIDSGPYQNRILDGGFRLMKGEYGVFICIPAWRPSLKAPKENPHPLQVYGFQGFLFYDFERGDTVQITNQDTSFPSTRILYNYIKSKTGRGYSICPISEMPNPLGEGVVKTKVNSVEANNRNARSTLGYNLNVYPNPVMDYAHLKVLDTGLVDLKIWDSSGKIVLHLTNISPLRLLNIDMTSLMPGAYEGRVYTQSTSYFFKFIKVSGGQ